MELLILLNRAETHADVVAASEAPTAALDPRARAIRPGESYLGIPYDVWRACKDQTVDLFDYADRASLTNAPDLAPSLVPRSIPKPIAMRAVLDSGFQLIRRGAVPLLAVAAALQCGLLLVGLGITRAGSTGATGVLIGFLFLALVWYGMAQTALISVASYVYHGLRPRLADVLPETAQRGPAVIGGLVLVWLFVGLGMLVFIIPGFILLCRYYAVPAVLVLEDRDPWSALGRSGSLSAGNGGTIFLLAVILEILTYLVTAGAQGLQAAGGLTASLATVAGFVAGTFMFMLKAAVVTAFYYALRISREAYDLELLTDSLDTGSPVPA